MSNQIVISSGAKVRSLNGVITGTTGVLDSLPINASNGIPQLDVNGKILVSQLPNSVMEYKGTWNANTNTPTLTNGGAFNQGDVYLCNVAGTTDFGAGPIAFVVGDQVIYSGSIWQRASGASGTVTSVAITESGDALTITGSPITTSGTINVGFAGTSAQYVAGNGALVTFPTLTGYVPYTGATANVDLGLYNLYAQNVFANDTSGNWLASLTRDSFTAIGILALKSNGFTNYLQPLTTVSSARTWSLPNASGTIALTSDLSDYVTLATSQTITGLKTFNTPIALDNALNLKFDASINAFGGYYSLYAIKGVSSGNSILALYDGDTNKKSSLTFDNANNYNYLFPSASGTVALTSDLTGGTVTSVGLTMPVAFNVASSPITTSGTLAVTAAGYASQYIRGDGTLADFPSSGGGGSSVSYYLNGGTSQGVIGGTTYYEMSKTADTGTGVDFPKTGDGLIVSFLTDANDPAQLTIPGGNWNYEIYVSMSANGGTPELYAELYKYDGTTFTLISTSTNEILYDGTTLNLYTFAMAVPTTTLTVTDRLAVKLYATNSGGKTTTVHTQNGHLCQVITTFSTGITALNGLTTQVQYLATGTSGTDFNISSATATHTFNLPTASAANRGALSSADWTTFNNKQSTLSLTTTGNNGSATLVSNTLNVPTYTLAGLGGISLISLSATTPLSYNNTTGAFSIQVANTSQDGYLSSTDWNTFNGKQNTITNPVTGTGTSGQVTYFNGTSSVTSSSSFKFDGTNLTIGNPTTALAQLHVYNASAAATILLQTNSTTDYSEIAVRNNSSTATSYFRQYSTAATGSDFGISRAGLAMFFSNYATNFAIGTRNGGDLILGTNDVERARMFSATGNLSLNSSSDAGYKLDVNGTGRFGGTSTYNGFLIGSHSNNVGAAIYNKGLANATLYADSASTVLNAETNLYLRTGNTDRLTIASTGAATFSSSVTATTGLFKVSADRNLAIKYDTNVTLSAQGDSGGPESLRVYADTFRLFTSTTAGGLTERFTIANTGAATFSSSVKGKYFNVTGTNGLSGYLIQSGDWEGNASTDLAVAAESANLRFYTNGSATERMRITSGGNVLIGQTTASGSVNGMYFRPGIESGFIVTNDIALQLGRLGSTGDIQSFYSGSTRVGTISVSSTNTSYNTSSDYRLKEDLKDYSGLDIVGKIKTYDFAWKTDKSRNYGVIAHEIAEVMPYVVMGEKDAEFYQGVDYSKIVPILIKSIQELEARLKTIENK